MEIRQTEKFQYTTMKKLKYMKFNKQNTKWTHGILFQNFHSTNIKYCCKAATVSFFFIYEQILQMKYGFY